jgi:hypothetical protein
MAGITLLLRSLRGQKNRMVRAVSQEQAFARSVDTDLEAIPVNEISSWYSLRTLCGAGEPPDDFQFFL